MEFFDEEKLLTYSALLPAPNGEFLLDGNLMLSAQERIYSRNMAEKADLRGSEVVNSILSALIVNKRSKTFRLAVRYATIDDRKKTGCIQYASFRLLSENHQKLKDLMELINEVAPIPPTEPPFGLRFLQKKQNVSAEMSVAIDVALSLFQTESEEK